MVNSLKCYYPSFNHEINIFLHETYPLVTTRQDLGKVSWKMTYNSWLWSSKFNFQNLSYTKCFFMFLDILEIWKQDLKLSCWKFFLNQIGSWWKMAMRKEKNIEFWQDHLKTLWKVTYNSCSWTYNVKFQNHSSTKYFFILLDILESLE